MGSSVLCKGQNIANVNPPSMGQPQVPKCTCDHHLRLTRVHRGRGAAGEAGRQSWEGRTCRAYRKPVFLSWMQPMSR